MCGIIGVLGNHEAAPIMVESLKRLEYRGYDSAGIATINENRLERRRALGKLVNLSDMLVHEPLAGKSGIGHTRWATHGAPSVVNAHPHQSGSVAVVHNGIIENFRELREELQRDGISFLTETDTETVAMLANKYLQQGLSPKDAARETIARLEGAFALCFLFEGHDDLLIAARKGSPLAIGHGDGEMFIGSDAIALSPMTNQITYLEEGDWTVVTRSGYEIYDKGGNQTYRPIKTIDMDSTRIEKGGHKHYMAKEIAEQPTVLGDAFNHYLGADGQSINVFKDGFDFADYDQIVMIACGSAYLACLTAKYWFEDVARMPVEVDVASEFRYREPPIGANTLAIFISQSGETADTLAALRYCVGKAAKIVSVVNAPESSIAREADIALPILAGTEISVASTKGFTCQLAVMAILMLQAASDRKCLTTSELAAKIATLRTIPALMSQAISTSDLTNTVSLSISEAKDVLFLGRGRIFPLALEGALKLKEISYIHAEGYASGELKHGPIALIDHKMPVVVMAPSDALFDKTISNVQEVMARDGKIILISDKDGIQKAGKDIWQAIEMPCVDPLFAPILYAVPAQLLAYHTAVAKGADVDQPRNLAKSVTVE